MEVDWISEMRNSLCQGKSSEVGDIEEAAGNDSE